MHIESAHYYGSSDATLSFNEFLEFLRREDSHPFFRKQIHSLPVKITQSEEEECYKFPRRFNIDLQPKFLFCTGDVVDWLIQSGVSTYLEFKPVLSGFMWAGDHFEEVPCNKSQIFQDQRLTMIEKRLLMRFIETCRKLHESEFDPNDSFLELMNSKELPQNLQDIVLYCVLFITGESSAVTLGEALGSLMKYATSLGVYKENSALMYPMYGSSDISQAFCRLAAVYEGLYVITEELKLLTVEYDSDVKVIHSTFGELRGRELILGAAYSSLDSNSHFESEREVQRGVALCRILEGEKEYDSPVLFSIPPNSFDNSLPIYILQLNENTSTVPAGYKLFQFYTESPNSDCFEGFLRSVPCELLAFASYSQMIGKQKGLIKCLSNPGRGFELVEHFVILT